MLSLSPLSLQRSNGALGYGRLLLTPAVSPTGSTIKEDSLVHTSYPSNPLHIQATPKARGASSSREDLLHPFCNSSEVWQNQAGVRWYSHLLCAYEQLFTSRWHCSKDGQYIQGNIQWIKSRPRAFCVLTMHLAGEINLTGNMNKDDLK